MFKRTPTVDRLREALAMNGTEDKRLIPEPLDISILANSFSLTKLEDGSTKTDYYTEYDDGEIEFLGSRIG